MEKLVTAAREFQSELDAGELEVDAPVPVVQNSTLS